MKVTFVLPGSGRSGGIKSTVKAANGLLRRGHQVRLLVNSKMDVRSRCRMLWLAARYAGANDWVDLFEGRVEMFGDITKCHFDGSEIVVASGGWAAKEIQRLDSPRIKKVHYIRGIDSHDPERMRLLWAEQAPKIVIASYLEGVIEETCGQRPAAVIPIGIDAGEYYAAVPEGQRDGVGTIFGRSYHKDPKTVIAVLNQLRQDRPALVQRVFGACRRPAEIPREIYTRLPSLDKARRIYSQSLVWFLGSYSEGFPAPILEAMACGCAVVATDCGGPRDIITDGEDGFLVEVGNPSQMADRVKMLLDDENLRRQFVRKSQETVRRFSWDSSVGELEHVLLSVCEHAHGQTGVAAEGTLRHPESALREKDNQR